MKNSLILFTLACLPFLGIAQGQHKKPKPTKDPNVYDLTKNQGTFIEYETPSELKTSAAKEADLKMSSVVATPAGGQLVLTYSRMSIEAGNSQWFTVVVHDPEGKEIFRKELDSKVPIAIFGPTTYWKNTRIIPLEEPLQTGAKVYIVDAITKKRHEYLIKN